MSTDDRCHDAPCNALRAAAFKPSWASEITSFTPARPRRFREELGPERLLLRVASGETEDLTVAAGSDPGGDHHRTRHNLMQIGVTRFDVGGAVVAWHEEPGYVGDDHGSSSVTQAELGQ